MNIIKNCEFYGVKWDDKAIEAVNNIAKSILNLTELFKAQNITIETMLKVEGCSDKNKFGEEDSVEGI